MGRKPTDALESLNHRIWLASRALTRANEAKDAAKLEKAQRQYDRAMEAKDEWISRNGSAS